jgi:hypothetical protein
MIGDYLRVTELRLVQARRANRIVRRMFYAAGVNHF